MAGSVCVQCGAAVPAVLVRTGSRQRVAHCKACGRTCDEYFEADGGLVLLDLLLHRPPAYRHVMRNLVAHACRGLILSWATLGQKGVHCAAAHFRLHRAAVHFALRYYALCTALL